MAKGVSGYTSEYGTSSKGKVRVYFSEDYDISTNSSSVKITLETFKGWESGGSWYLDGILKVNDEEVLSSYRGGQIGIGMYEDGWYHVTSSNITIPHKQDGSQTMTISFHNYGFNDGFTFSKRPYPTALFGVNDGESETFNLTKIPRSAAISHMDDAIVGSSCKISWNNLSANFRYRLKFSIGNWHADSEIIFPSVIGKYIYSGYIFPNDVAYEITRSKYGKIKVELSTYSDANCKNKVGVSSVKYLNISVPDEFRPKIDVANISIVNDNGVIQTWGVAVSGYTKLKVSANASALYGATITNFNISGAYNLDLQTQNVNYIGGSIYTPGDIALSIFATDSRSLASNPYRTNSIKFLPYKPPLIKKFITTRIEDSEKLGHKKVRVQMSWDYSDVGGRNKTTCKIYYQKVGIQSWTECCNVENNTSIILDPIFDETKSYNFKAILSDSIGNSYEAYSFISTRQVLLDFRPGGKGLGIGKISETDGLEVDFESRFNKDVYINNVLLSDYISGFIPKQKPDPYPVGSIYMSTNNTSPAELFGGSWEPLKKCFLFAADDSVETYKAGATGGEFTHKLVEKELPVIDGSWATGVVGQHGSKGVTGHAYGTSFPNIKDAYDSSSAGTQWGYGYKFGGDKPHNNMPPYLAVYMWQRVS